jgi:hypothetical protein
MQQGYKPWLKKERVNKKMNERDEEPADVDGERDSSNLKTDQAKLVYLNSGEADSP